MLDFEQEDEFAELQDEIQAELDAHEEWGFYVPTREELVGTTGEFFLHMLAERE
jgi:hypothetical protein